MPFVDISSIPYSSSTAKKSIDIIAFREDFSRLAKDIFKTKDKPAPQKNH